MGRAISIAIENGYLTPPVLVNTDMVLLDPLFWQALGKGLGWGETMHRLEYFVDGEEKYLYWKGENGHQYTPHIIGWKYYMHRFIDHLAEGKDIDSFFDSFFTNLTK